MLPYETCVALRDALIDAWVTIESEFGYYRDGDRIVRLWRGGAPEETGWAYLCPCYTLDDLLSWLDGQGWKENRVESRRLGDGTIVFWAYAKRDGGETTVRECREAISNSSRLAAVAKLCLKVAKGEK